MSAPRFAFAALFLLVPAAAWADFDFACAPLPDKPDHTWMFSAGEQVPDWLEQVDPAHKATFRLRFGRAVTVVLDANGVFQVIPRGPGPDAMHDECSVTICDGPSIKGCQRGVHFMGRLIVNPPGLALTPAPPNRGGNAVVRVRNVYDKRRAKKSLRIPPDTRGVTALIYKL